MIIFITLLSLLCNIGATYYISKVTREVAVKEKVLDALWQRYEKELMAWKEQTSDLARRVINVEEYVQENL